jgi:hypothetical protein
LKVKKGVAGMLEAVCPKCGAKLVLYVDLSMGPPDEVGTECDCGAIPTWRLDWDYVFELGDFLYDDREQDGGGGDG